MLLDKRACASPRRETCISVNRPPGHSSRYCRRLRQMSTCSCWPGTSQTMEPPEEARALVKELAATVRIPIVAVLGNHDFEAGAEQEIHQILVDHGVCVLDGDTCEVQGVGFAGIKGFAGGFGRRALGPWGSKSSSSSCTRP